MQVATIASLMWSFRGVDTGVGFCGKGHRQPDVSFRHCPTTFTFAPDSARRGAR